MLDLEKFRRGEIDDPILPVLTLRDIVVFPKMMVPLFVGREKSVRALENAMRFDKQIFLLAQKDAAQDDPGPEDVYKVGSIASILQLLKLPDGTAKLMVEGIERAKLQTFTQTERFFEARIAPMKHVADVADAEHARALIRSLITQFQEYSELSKKIPGEVMSSLAQIEDAEKLADSISGHLHASVAEKQKILELPSVQERLEHILKLVESEIDVLQMQKRIRKRVKGQLEKTQREYYLNEQMRAIQKELGEDDSGRDELAEIEERIEKIRLTKEARTKARNELKKLRQMSPISAEATVVRNYLDWLLSLPWGKRKRVKNNLQEAEHILDEDHYGLEKIKERILEHLAVQQRCRKLRGPILCLVGPPGVGKTSLGKSIARATGREFVRMSLGGVRDEAEIRGHRRTYIGSMPGRVIQSMKKAAFNNPLFLLDEIDKIGVDFRGDPAAALLEVLDPEQNNVFADHYLEVEYDLSNVLFLTTANTLNIPPALADRMEVIRISGYTEEEKLEIAKRHLIPKSIEGHGLRKKEFSIDEKSLRLLIRTYTREAGVRNLERELNSLARKAVRRLLAGKAEGGVVNVHKDNLEDLAGVPKFRDSMLEERNRIGVVTGLAWTEFGGEILTIEGVMLPGKGKMVVTGNLRDVMKESISAANSYVKSRSPAFGIEPPAFDKRDIHVHVPEGATPKDGPSAGVAMATAIVSVMTQIPVRREIAMTGEITLRGRVLPVGGLKEKLLAALRNGVSTVLIPEENARELAEIPDSVKDKLKIMPVSVMDEVVEIALEHKPEPIEWEEDSSAARASYGGGEESLEKGDVATGMH